MPLVFRTMKKEGEQPKIGRSATTLGVRVLTERADIPVDASGCVSPSTGGMSVAPAWRQLPAHRVPARLKHLCPKARGQNDVHCWRIGNGEFVDGPLASGLNVRLDSATHGLVEPADIVPLDIYEADLAATLHQWMIDES
jgi:hypothetical protein